MNKTIKYYTVHTMMTAKPMGRPSHDANYSDGEYRMFDTQEIKFDSLKEVKEHLFDTYGTCKKIPMYQDDASGKAVKVGTIYCFNNKDYSHDNKSWHQQDWVTVHEVSDRIIVA